MTTDVSRRGLAVSLAAMLLTGAFLRMLIDWANHSGPAGDGWSLQGNGAFVFLPLVPLALLIGLAEAMWHRRWLVLPLLPFSLVAGLWAGGLFKL